MGERLGRLVLRGFREETRGRTSASECTSLTVYDYNLHWPWVTIIISEQFVAKINLNV